MHSATLLAFLLPIAVQDGVPDVKPTTEQTIKRAVETYQQPWLPEDAPLRGVVVGVHARGNGAFPIGEGVFPCEDFLLLTAGHLFHLITQAKGTAVVCPAEPASFVSADAVFREKKCDVLLVLEMGFFGEGGAARGRATDTGLNAALTGELRGQGATQSAMPAELLFDAPGANVVLGPPGGMQNREQVRIMARRYASSIYRGLAKHAQEAHQAKPADTPGADEPADEPQDERAARSPRRGKESRQASLALQLTGGATLVDEQFERFINLYARTAPPDRTIVHFAPTLRRDGQAIVLGGTTNVPALIDGTASALAAVGVQELRNDLKALPNQSALGSQSFGACKATMSLVYDKPSGAAGVVTQLLYGEPVFLLDCADGWLMVQAGDGYWGWAREEAIHRMTAEVFDAYRALERVVLTRELGTGEGNRQVPLPRGAKLGVLDRETASVTVRAADGTRMSVPVDAVRPLPADSSAETRVLAALDMLYTPYKWGGRSAIGLDCSGLITNVGAQTGINPPRDAWQQALVGSLVATEWHRSAIQRGDLLYFVDATGRVYHTAIAIDATHFVHAAVPEVQIGSFDKADRLYDKRLDTTFFIAKRP